MKKTYLGFMAMALLVGSLSAAPKKKKPTWEQRKESFKNLKEVHLNNIEKAIPVQATAKAIKERKVLVFYRCEGFVHGSIPYGNHALKKMAEKTGAFSVEFSDRYTDLSIENLEKYDLLLFNSTTRLKMPEVNRSAILAFINKGKGIAGIHAASDNFADWEQGSEMMGGVFNGHPWNAKGEWAFKNDEPKHELNKAFNGHGFWCKDEIYCYKKPVNRDAVRVLISLDMSKKENLAKVQNAKMVKDKFGVDDPKKNRSSRFMVSLLWPRTFILYQLWS